MRVRDMLDAGQFRAGSADLVHNGIAYLVRQNTPPRHRQFYRARESQSAPPCELRPSTRTAHRNRSVVLNTAHSLI
jgi:hypothetical protein